MVIFPLRDNHRGAGIERVNVLGLKTQVQQRHAFAGRGEERAFDGVAEGFDPQRIAGHHHLAQRAEIRQAVGAIELLSDAAHHVDQRRPAVARQFAADLVHDDFGIRRPRQMVLIIFQQLVAQFGIVGKLPVEGERKPFALLQMVPLEGLGVAEVFAAASGVPNMADGGLAGVPGHQRFRFAAVVEPKRLGHRAQLAIGFQNLLALGVVGGEPGRKLPAILDIQEQPRHQSGNFGQAVRSRQRARFVPRQMINGRDATLVPKIAHESHSIASPNETGGRRFGRATLRGANPNWSR